MPTHCDIPWPLPNAQVLLASCPNHFAHNKDPREEKKASTITILLQANVLIPNVNTISRFSYLISQ